MSINSLYFKDTGDIEKFYLDTTGMIPDYLQLSTGTPELQLKVVELAGVTIIWSRLEGRSRWRDEMSSTGLHLGMVFNSTGPVTVRGEDIGTDCVQVWMPGKEIHYVLNGPYLALEIGVAPHLVEELGWDLKGDPLKRISRAKLVQLKSTCRRATIAAHRGRTGSAGQAVEPDITHLRNLILDALEPVLLPWSSGSDEESIRTGSRHLRIVSQGEALIDSISCASRLEIEFLSRSLGVSRRTLFRAYRKVLGISPYRYFELKRLSEFRSRLRQTSISDATVTTIATELGFADMGRLATRYRNQFGENPSETLRRTELQ